MPMAAGNDQPSKLRSRSCLIALYMCSRGLLRAATSDYVACSSSAASWLFGKKTLESGEVSIVPNPVDIDACAFDEKVRKRIRMSLGIGDELVVGSITAFKKIKNPFFLIDVFAQFRKARPLSTLLVVGGGELEDEVRAYAEKKLEEGSYLFLGKVSEAYEYYQAFDVFVLPSVREGFSIASLEAQAAGLPCLLSEGIPEDALALKELCSRVPLAEGSAFWAQKLLCLAQNSSKNSRDTAAERMKDMGYSPEATQAIFKMLE